jgi:hypothetical protein
MQHKELAEQRQKFHWRTFARALVYVARAAFALCEKESQNGLENPEDRRSAGWHGNQHVCVRRPQVSGSDNSGLTQVDFRPNTFLKGIVQGLASTFER